MDTIIHFIETINGFLWGEWTLFILMASGILFTLWTKFIQFKALTHGIQVVRGVYDNPDDPGAISHFQALAAALSATVGLGNIGGVAIAISVGGPGSLFWIWIIGFFGMALKSVEVALTMLYRNVEDPNNPSGGAMWVIKKTLGAEPEPWKKTLATILGSFFCVTLLISATTGGNMFQSWNVADLSNHYFGLPKLGTGIVLAVLVGAVILGGIKRIGSVAGTLVPVMCGLYVAAALVVIGMNISAVPGLFVLIVKSAFSPLEAGGAFLGASVGFAFSQGLKRALFSNEAGQGSAPIAHAAAKTDEPVREGVVAGMEPFIDTIMICTLTALVILSTGTWNRGSIGELQGSASITLTPQDETVFTGPTGPENIPTEGTEAWHSGNQLFIIAKGSENERVKIMATVQEDDLGALSLSWAEAPQGIKFMKLENGMPDLRVYRDYKGATMTGYAFDRAFPGLGKYLVTIAAWLFAISTMISWTYYGEQGIIFLFGKRGVMPYKLFMVVMAAIAPITVTTDKQLGSLIDFGTGWMLWANMPIVLLMGYLAVKGFNEYFAKLERGEFKRYK